MGWSIKCSDATCKANTYAGNIVDLVSSHCNKDGWFLCKCGKPGYVEKSFTLQEGDGEKWEPFLRGIVKLGRRGDIYQPFVFLVSDKPTGLANDMWFSYYKDMRHKKGGRLKLGYGPGGPPVLGKRDLLRLLHHLVDIGCVSAKNVLAAIK